MQKRKFKKGHKFGKWTLNNFLGGGGNGEVWAAYNDDGEHAAIKILKWVKLKPYARFKDEIVILEKNSDLLGIIPILDKFLPSDKSGNTPFYVMPIAIPALTALKDKGIEAKVDAIIDLSSTLLELHSRGISHRDIKPANLLLFNNRFVFADFGLVDYPNKKDVSSKNEEIGPKWTMAPEMRRDAQKANGFKADIYSLAKTLWIILTDNHKGFDGQYLSDPTLEIRKFYKEIYTTPIDELLTVCTDNNPDNRLGLKKVIEILHDWKNLNENFHERNRTQWAEIQRKLFPMAFPKRVIWEDVNDIVNILKLLCSYESLNHLFFPNSGGEDLEDVRLSYEPNCIELDFRSVDIVKPKRLLFESLNYDPEWNYFRLELDELKPSDVYNNEDEEIVDQEERDQEYLSELYPGKYDRYGLIENSFEYISEGYEIPESARNVTRWFRGSFVIFNKRSPYNLTSETYDGRHSKMSTDEFREYIEANIECDKKMVNELKRTPEKLKYYESEKQLLLV